MAGTFSRLLYHIVFSTKQRAPLIDPDLRAELYPYIGGIIRQQGGWLLALGGIPDHVHILVRLKPVLAVADLVREVKSGSSKWIHERARSIPDFGWQTGYAVFSVSESNEGVVRRYIQNQEEHHRKATFKQELVALLQKHGIEYDPAYLWD
ncbi:MAG TPA: IS200/IS605 family transposase [Thermoanaerobaculia bacterium]|nr:IS200/IS605 family transposase [Thermoanaerobaculia bacterium]